MKTVMKLLFRKKVGYKTKCRKKKKRWYSPARYLAFIWFKMLISEFSRNSLAFHAPGQQHVEKPLEIIYALKKKKILSKWAQVPMISPQNHRAPSLFAWPSCPNTEAGRQTFPLHTAYQGIVLEDHWCRKVDPSRPKQCAFVGGAVDFQTGRNPVGFLSNILEKQKHELYTPKWQW